MRTTAFNSHSHRRRGFTLLEALFGSVILAVSVLALGLAISAGQRASLEGRKAVLGAMVVDDLIAELGTVEYADLVDYDAFEQNVGAVATLDGVEYPATFWPVGRRVEVTEQEIDVPDLEVKVRGMRIVVTAFDDARDVAAAETFIPEPAS